MEIESAEMGGERMVRMVKEKDIAQVKEISIKKVRTTDEALLFFLDVLIEFCSHLKKLSFSCISLQSNIFPISRSFFACSQSERTPAETFHKNSMFGVHGHQYKGFLYPLLRDSRKYNIRRDKVRTQ